DRHVLGGKAELVGHDLGPGGLVPLALAAGAGAEQCLPRHVDPQLGGVEHLDPEDVELPAVPGAQRLGHRGDAYAEETAPLAGLLLLLPERVVADRLETKVEALGVLTRVGEEPEGGAVREVVVPDERSEE